MQNFTFGRKGTNWFLFAFVLLIGTLPSFGQDCATVVDEDSGEAGNQQSFCYLSTVADIQTSNGTNTAIFETDDTVNDTQPIDSGELLTTGTTYYVGSTTEDCDRVAVTTTVTSPATPDNSLYPGQNSFTLSPCVSSGFSVADLEGLFTADAGSNYAIQAYTTEFGDELATGDLVPGENYFVAQVSTVSGECPSTRAAVGYDPTEAPAPLADSPQDLCEGATVADLVAEGTEENTQAIRWYRSATSNSPLADDVQLIDGEDYFAAQIVNDRNDPFPPCETPAGDRVRIEVTLQDFNAGADVSETICQSDLQSRLNNGESPTEVFLSYVNVTEDIAEVTFDPPISSIVTDYSSNPFQTFTTDATFTTETGCEDTVEIEVTVVEDFEAGDDNLGNTLCRSDIGDNVTAQSVEDYLTGLLSENADPNGEFSPEPADIANSINSSSDEISFDIVYTVGQGTGCEDTADLQVTILEGVDYELVQLAPLCNDDIPALVNEIPEDVEDLFLANFGENIPEGEFEEGTIQAVINQYNQQNIDTFTATYIAGAANGCNEAIELSRTVIAGQQAEAGNFDNIEDVCTNQDPIDLTSLTNNNPDAISGGTFSGTGVENNQFDPSVGEGLYTITYTVNESVDCVSGSEQTTFTIEVIQGPDAGNDIQDSICISEVEEIAENFDPSNPEATLIELFERFDWNGDIDGSFSPNVNILGGQLLAYYADENREPEITLNGTYTVGDSQDECGTDQATFAITIVDGELLDAGEDNTENELCNAQIPALVNSVPDDVEALYFDLLEEGVPQNGTFNPSIQEIIADYNSDNFQTFNTTYTIGTDACGDSVELAITVIPVSDANAGEIDDQVVCTTDGMIDLIDFLDQDAQTTGTFTGDGVEGNMFDPSAGTTDITYTVNSDSDCVTEGTEDSTIFTISVIEPGEAIAEANDDTINICTTETSYDLRNALSENTTPGGSFTLNGEELEGTTFDATSVEAGEYSFIYNVSSADLECIEGEATASFTINVTSDFNFGNEIKDILCESQVPTNLTADIIEDYYLDLVSGLPSGGTFSTTPEEILAQYNENPNDTFSTTYTVESGECQGSVIVSVTVQEEGDADAGEIEGQVVCTTDGMIDLEQYLVGTGAQMGGTFSGEGVEDNMFNANMEADEYEITYTVTDAAPCVTEGTEDSNTFTITIIEPGQAIADAMDDEIDVCTSETSYNLNDALSEESTLGGTFLLDGEEFEGTTFDATSLEAGEYSFTYNVSSEDSECIEGEASASFIINVTSETFDAGEDETFTVCSVGLDTAPTIVEVRNYYLNLLEDGIPQNGTFSPSIEEIREAYIADQIGTFSTTYTLGNGSCEDSAELTVIVTDEIQAEVDEIADQTLCSSDENIDLFNYLSEDSTQGGAFDGYEDGTFSPSMMGAGSYEITYTVGEDIPCVEGEASTTFTIQVLQGANAGEDMDVTVCNNQTVQDLFNFISADADMDGEFTLNGEVITDGIMDPSAFEVGTYEVIYSVTAEADECGGDDTAAITITLGDAPEAPTTSGETVAFCAIDAPTAALLEAEGTNLTWYSDATLMTIVTDEDLLVSGEYFVTQTAENGCESEAAMITVNIVDSPAPTISADYELCEFDNPTLADLTAEINETGEVTWYESADSMTALSDNAMLTDGTTYYATLISDNGCESSERLAVTVTLEDCALLFPEAITPNGDGMNDRFVIENIESEYPNYNITIFNRWGSAVYKGNASVPAWDGTSNQSGSLGDGVLPVGVYFYVVDFNDGSTEPRQGRVYLNR
jgi:gliding motility-associated-like protein